MFFGVSPKTRTCMGHFSEWPKRRPQVQPFLLLLAALPRSARSLAVSALACAAWRARQLLATTYSEKSRPSHTKPPSLQWPRRNTRSENNFRHTCTKKPRAVASKTFGRSVTAERTQYLQISENFEKNSTRFLPFGRRIVFASRIPPRPLEAWRLGVGWSGVLRVSGCE